jgi:hypothetical protein
MRPCQAVVALVCAGLCGCATTKLEPTAPHFAAAGPFAGAAGADVVQMDVAVIERPYGDDFLNRGLWDFADEQAVGLERKPTLDENGFRVCQIGGMTPAGLQKLLTSPRSCTDPRRVQVHAGQAVPVPLGAPWKHCRFRLHQDGQATAVDFEDAACLLEVTPTLTDDGKIRLQFTPHVKHGAPALEFAARQEPSGALRWDRQNERPDECYTRLSWDMTIAPNEFVVIGTRLDRPDTLGQTYFLPAPDDIRVQRVLVIRTGRSLAEAPSDLEIGRSPPLALRAGLITARGKAD